MVQREPVGHGRAVDATPSGDADAAPAPDVATRDRDRDRGRGRGHTRRSVLRAVGAGALLAGGAGCTSPGANGGGTATTADEATTAADAETDGTATDGEATTATGEATTADGTETNGAATRDGDDAQAVEDWLSEADNFDGTVEDRTGEDAVEVAVGAEGNGGNLAFAPPAIRVSTGTTVVWEWTGEGGLHNVVAEDGAFDSGDPVDDEEETFEYTFEEAGVYNYLCEPHEPIGMLGSVVVESESGG